MRPLVAVTGATGFLGRHVVQRLVKDGWRVRMLARRHVGDFPRGVQAVIGSLEDRGALERLVEGAQAVVHAAGLVKARRAGDFQRVNVEGARALGQAMRRAASDARLVVVSSLAAREPHLSPYAASKADGEAAIISESGASSWLVLRPTALYGPWDRATLPLFQAALGCVLPIPRRPSARLSLLHVGDAAAAIAVAVGSPATGSVWELGRGSHSWGEVAQALARAVGNSPRLVAVPGLLVPLLAGPFLSPGKVREVLHGDWTCQAASLPPVGVWRPLSALNEGLAQTAEWYRRNGWL